MSYSREHLLAILALARKLKLPIISDEVYADMVFAGQRFYSLQELSTVRNNKAKKQVLVCLSQVFFVLSFSGCSDRCVWRNCKAFHGARLAGGLARSVRPQRHVPARQGRRRSAATFADHSRRLLADSSRGAVLAREDPRIVSCFVSFYQTHCFAQIQSAQLPSAGGECTGVLRCSSRSAGLDGAGPAGGHVLHDWHQSRAVPQVPVGCGVCPGTLGAAAGLCSARQLFFHAVLLPSRAMRPRSHHARRCSTNNNFCE